MLQAAALRYLVFVADGAELRYSGGDEAAYAEARRAAVGHAGALTGMCIMGAERWRLTCYFRTRPADAFIRGRRERGLFGLAWEEDGREPAAGTGEPAIDG